MIEGRSPPRTNWRSIGPITGFIALVITIASWAHLLNKEDVSAAVDLNQRFGEIDSRLNIIDGRLERIDRMAGRNSR